MNVLKKILVELLRAVFVPVFFTVSFLSLIALCFFYFDVIIPDTSFKLLIYITIFLFIPLYNYVKKIEEDLKKLRELSLKNHADIADKIDLFEHSLSFKIKK